MNFLKGFLVVPGIALMMISCASFPKDHYKSERLSFNTSDEFFIRRPKTDKHTQITYVKVVNKDLKQFATISVDWLPGEQDLDKTLKTFTISLSEIYEDPKFDAAFGLPMNGQFGSHTTRRVNYFVNNDPRKGTYHAFHCNGVTVIIGEHYFPESESSVKKCMNVIQETLSCF